MVRRSSKATSQHTTLRPSGREVVNLKEFSGRGNREVQRLVHPAHALHRTAYHDEIPRSPRVGYLRGPIDRLAFEMPSSGPAEPARAVATPFAALVLQTSDFPTTSPPEVPAQAPEIPVHSSVGAKGFEPLTFCSQIDGRAVAGAHIGSQRSRTIGFRIEGHVQRSGVFIPFRRRFTSPVLQSKPPPVDGFGGRRAARGLRRDGLPDLPGRLAAPQPRDERDTRRSRVARCVRRRQATGPTP